MRWEQYMLVQPFKNLYCALYLLDFLKLSLWWRSWISLLEKGLCCLSKRREDVPEYPRWITVLSVFSSPPTPPRFTILQTIIELTFMFSLFSLLVLPPKILLHQHTAGEVHWQEQTGQRSPKSPQLCPSLSLSLYWMHLSSCLSADLKMYFF